MLLREKMARVETKVNELKNEEEINYQEGSLSINL